MIDEFFFVIVCAIILASLFFLCYKRYSDDRRFRQRDRGPEESANRPNIIHANQGREEAVTTLTIQTLLNHWRNGPVNDVRMIHESSNTRQQELENISCRRTDLVEKSLCKQLYQGSGSKNCDSENENVKNINHDIHLEEGVHKETSQENADETNSTTSTSRTTRIISSISSIFSVNRTNRKSAQTKDTDNVCHPSVPEPVPVQTITQLETVECPICLDEYQVGETIAWTNANNVCKHTFHLECISIWLMQSDDCPLCRVNILTQNDENKEQIPVSSAAVLAE